jgi:hypothetical protein
LKRREKAKDKEIVMFDRIRVTLSMNRNAIRYHDILVESEASIKGGRRNGQKVIKSESDSAQTRPGASTRGKSRRGSPLGAMRVGDAAGCGIG